jgi:hypothetical protein
MPKQKSESLINVAFQKKLSVTPYKCYGSPLLTGTCLFYGVFSKNYSRWDYSYLVSKKQLLSKNYTKEIVTELSVTVRNQIYKIQKNRSNNYFLCYSNKINNVYKNSLLYELKVFYSRVNKLAIREDKSCDPFQNLERKVKDDPSFGAMSCTKNSLMFFTKKEIVNRAITRSYGFQKKTYTFKLAKSYKLGSPYFVVYSKGYLPMGRDPSFPPVEHWREQCQSNTGRLNFTQIKSIKHPSTPLSPPKGGMWIISKFLRNNKKGNEYYFRGFATDLELNKKSIFYCLKYPKSYFNFLEPNYETDFSPTNVGFRPGRSVFSTMQTFSESVALERDLFFQQTSPSAVHYLKRMKYAYSPQVNYFTRFSQATKGSSTEWAPFVARRERLNLKSLYYFQNYSNSLSHSIFCPNGIKSLLSLKQKNVFYALKEKNCNCALYFSVNNLKRVLNKKRKSGTQKKKFYPYFIFLKEKKTTFQTFRMSQSLIFFMFSLLFSNFVYTLFSNLTGIVNIKKLERDWRFCNNVIFQNMSEQLFQYKVTSSFLIPGLVINKFSPPGEKKRKQTLLPESLCNQWFSLNVNFLQFLLSITKLKLAFCFSQGRLMSVALPLTLKGCYKMFSLKKAISSMLSQKCTTLVTIIKKELFIFNHNYQYLFGLFTKGYYQLSASQFFENRIFLISNNFFLLKGLSFLIKDFFLPPIEQFHTFQSSYVRGEAPYIKMSGALPLTFNVLLTIGPYNPPKGVAIVDLSSAKKYWVPSLFGDLSLGSSTKMNSRYYSSPFSIISKELRNNPHPPKGGIRGIEKYQCSAGRFKFVQTSSFLNQMNPFLKPSIIKLFQPLFLLASYPFNPLRLAGLSCAPLSLKKLINFFVEKDFQISINLFDFRGFSILNLYYKEVTSIERKFTRVMEHLLKYQLVFMLSKYQLSNKLEPLYRDTLSKYIITGAKPLTYSSPFSIISKELRNNPHPPFGGIEMAPTFDYLLKTNQYSENIKMLSSTCGGSPNLGIFILSKSMETLIDRALYVIGKLLNNVSLKKFDPFLNTLKTHKRRLAEQGFKSMVSLPQGERCQITPYRGLKANTLTVLPYRGYSPFLTFQCNTGTFKKGSDTSFISRGKAPEDNLSGAKPLTLFLNVEKITNLFYGRTFVMPSKLSTKEHFQLLKDWLSQKGLKFMTLIKETSLFIRSWCVYYKIVSTNVTINLNNLKFHIHSSFPQEGTDKLSFISRGFAPGENLSGAKPLTLKRNSYKRKENNSFLNLVDFHLPTGTISSISQGNRTHQMSGARPLTFLCKGHSPFLHSSHTSKDLMKYYDFLVTKLVWKKVFHLIGKSSRHFLGRYLNSSNNLNKILYKFFIFVKKNQLWLFIQSFKVWALPTLVPSQSLIGKVKPISTNPFCKTKKNSFGNRLSESSSLEWYRLPSVMTVSFFKVWALPTLVPSQSLIGKVKPAQAIEKNLTNSRSKQLYISLPRHSDLILLNHYVLCFYKSPYNYYENSYWLISE